MKKVEKNWLEWLVFAASLVLVLSVLGYLVYDGATFGDTPPSIEFQLGQPQPRRNYFMVPVSAIELLRKSRTKSKLKIQKRSNQIKT